MLVRSKAHRAAWIASAAALLLMMISAPAAAQCSGWLPGMGLAGANGLIDDAVAWDPDGDGPLEDLLVVGGDFSIAGQEFALDIAAWDGTRWHPLAAGIPRPDGATALRVLALEVYQGHLYAAGSYWQNGYRAFVVRWDGDLWHEVAPISGTSVNALAKFGDELIIGGNFSTIGGVTTRHLARWNGSEVLPLTGMHTSGGAVRALTIHGGELIVGGTFSNTVSVPSANVARWSGPDGGWHPVGSGTPITVYSLTSFDGNLIVGGELPSGNTYVATVANWNGSSWTDLASVSLSNNSSSTVLMLAVHDGQLYAGGRFGWNTAGLHNIARWSGGSWQSVGGGLLGRTTSDLSQCALGATHYRGGLVVVGNFSDALPFGVAAIARWQDDAWHPFGGGLSGGGLGETRVLAMLPSGDGVIVGGIFNSIGDVSARRIARWDGAAWSPIGASGLYNPTGSSTAIVRSLAWHEGDLVAGGLFNTADGQPVNNIVRWDGSAWRALGSGLTGAVGTSVYALCSFGDRLIVSGNFAAAGGVQTSYLASWADGAWEPFGQPVWDHVLALEAYAGGVAAAGGFSSIGGTAAARTALWDGTQWLPVGVGMDEFFVNSLAASDGDLYAGGSFRFVGGAPITRVARWDGSQWLPLAAGADSVVSAITPYNGSIIAAGSFKSVGGIAASYIARWDGSAWQPLGAGLNMPVNSLAVHNGELLVGGAFTTADGQVSPYFARWSDNRAPWVARQPAASMHAGPGDPVEVRLIPATGYDMVAYEWRRNGQPITDGPAGASPNGGTVSGASGLLPSPTDGTPVTLTITNIQPSDAGEYSAVLSNACGESTSIPALLTVGASCPANWNHDYAVNSTDVSAYLTAWLDSVQHGTLTADFNTDGSVNSNDISAFLTAWLDAVTNGC